MRYSVLLLMWLLAARGQGLITFNNVGLYDFTSGTIYRAPVSLPDGTKASGDSFTAGLFLVGTDGFTPVVSTTFYPDGGLFPILFDNPVPGVPGGSPATFRARVWETAAGSYENAQSSGIYYYGEFTLASGSPLIEIPHLGIPRPFGDPSPDMSGIQPLVLVPEIKTLPLILFGMLFLAFRSVRTVFRAFQHDR